MSPTLLIIGFVRDLPKLAGAAQKRALVAHGLTCENIVVHGRQLKGRSRETWGWLCKKLRTGDTLAVVKLRAVYDPSLGRTPRKALFRALHQIEDMGVDILEVSTLRRSSVARERDMMIADCLDEIARSAKGGDAGRPKRELTTAERELAIRHWHSTEHPTNQIAVDAILSEAKRLKMTGLARLRSPQAFVNVFGASGRAKLRRTSK
jgi:hypothetical protein